MAEYQPRRKASPSPPRRHRSIPAQHHQILAVHPRRLEQTPTSARQHYGEQLVNPILVQEQEGAPKTSRPLLVLEAPPRLAVHPT